MRRGASNSSGISAPVFHHVPKGAVVDPIVRNCRGVHRWRVVGFSYQAHEIREKCAACGATQSRTFIERREAS